MRRVHIQLSDEDLELLRHASTASAASRSELVRRAIRSTYREPSSRERTKAERLEALRVSAGAWVDFPFTGEEYVEAIRGDFNERLRRLGLD